MTDYNPFAQSFSQSRKNMKWEEIDYFLSLLKVKKNMRMLDVGCGNGRLLGELISHNFDTQGYIGVDISSGLLGEAKKMYPTYDFIQVGMTQLNTLVGEKFDTLFFIASFHHLQSVEERIATFEQAFILLEEGGEIYMTNWALSSDINEEKYQSSCLQNSKNEFGGQDYRIKIGEHSRYYHGFTLDELAYLSSKVGFKIIENRLFDTHKNYVSILRK